MRIVLDTNVVVSGLLWPGPAARLLDLVRGGGVDAFTSEALLAELADVLSRKHLAPILARHEASASALVEGYSLLATSVTAAGISPTVLADPDDDAVLATALAGGADLIVSGDKPLRNIKSFHRIPIVGPAEAARRLEQAKSSG